MVAVGSIADNSGANANLGLMPAKSPSIRPIRSYVCRVGRLTTAQDRALKTLRQHYIVEPDKSFNREHIYGRNAPGCVEIGCGNGDTLMTLAKANPERDYLGIEVYPPGVGRLLAAVAAEGLTNVRIMMRDAAELFGQRIIGQRWSQVLIYFPDPWPKKRHHKRRLIQPPFVADVYAALDCGGRLRLATDYLPYAEQMLRVVSAQVGLRNLSPHHTYVPRPADRPITRFERRGHVQGRTALDLEFERIGG